MALVPHESQSFNGNLSIKLSHDQPIAPLTLEPNFEVSKPTKPKSGQLRGTVEVVGQMGQISQPSFFSCLDSIYESGESSRDHQPPVSKALASPAMNTPRVYESNTHSCPSPQVPPPSDFSLLPQAAIGNVDIS
ncbi:hypothetical protein FCV25MIE_19976 [Fagus crenata]